MPLLWYPVRKYEGMESSPNTSYTGATPNHDRPAIEYLLDMGTRISSCSARTMCSAHREYDYSGAGQRRRGECSR